MLLLQSLSNDSVRKVTCICSFTSDVTMSWLIGVLLGASELRLHMWHDPGNIHVGMATAFGWPACSVHWSSDKQHPTVPYILFQWKQFNNTCTSIHILFQYCFFIVSPPALDSSPSPTPTVWVGTSTGVLCAFSVAVREGTDKRLELGATRE